MICRDSNGSYRLALEWHWPIVYLDIDSLAPIDASASPPDESHKGAIVEEAIAYLRTRAPLIECSHREMPRSTDFAAEERAAALRRRISALPDDDSIHP